MAESRNSSLEQLTTNELIARKRDIEREINLRIQRQLNFLAAPRLPSAEDENQTQAAALLAYVDKADYDNIEQMWKRNPGLMFIEAPGNDGVLTTPLKRALYNLDTWTWKPFYEWIKQNKPGWEPTFVSQHIEQTHHTDLSLQPLFDEYAAYEAQLQKWYRDEISDAELDRQWKQFIEKQCELLPFHMIREMCREGDLWEPESRFDDITAPKDGCVYDLSVKKNIEIESVDFTSRFGSSLGLLRGWPAIGSCFATGSREWLQIWWVEEENRGGSVVLHDAGSLRELLRKRRLDLYTIPTLVQVEDKISRWRP